MLTWHLVFGAGDNLVPEFVTSIRVIAASEADAVEKMRTIFPGAGIAYAYAV